jgi:signal recognition particle subunit SRP54
MSSERFMLDDFKRQLLEVLRPDLMQSMISSLPETDQLAKTMSLEDVESEVRQMVGMIDSMTPQERRSPESIETSRGSRIARGSGVHAQAVRSLLKQFDLMAPIMSATAKQGTGRNLGAFSHVDRSDRWRFVL